MAHAGFANITTNATTLVKSGRGALARIVVGNAGSAWQAVVYDGIDATGQKIATISLNVTEELEFDVAVQTGITVVTSGTTPGDLTVIWD